MCGLVGIIQTDNKNYLEKQKLFNTLLFLDTVRGYDGTGVFYSKTFDEQADFYKKSYAAPDFQALPPYKKILSNIETYQFIIGHNRAATVGAISHTTAHPFVEGPITLVHNGTLRDTQGMPNRSVDSNSVAAALEAVENPTDVLENINGAFALIWHDSDHKALYIAKNDERPLHYADTPLGRVIASEKGMIEWVLDRLKIECKNGVKAFEDNRLYKWWTSKKGNLSFSSVEYKPFVPSYSNNNNLGLPSMSGKKHVAAYGTNTDSTLKKLKMDKNVPLLLKLETFEKYPGSAYKGKAMFKLENNHPNDLQIKAYNISESDMDWMRDAVLIADIESANETYAQKFITVSNVCILSEPEEDKKGGDNICPFPPETYKVDGMELTYDEYEDAVSDGCCMCATPLFWADRKKVSFLDGYTPPAPICHECMAQLHTPSSATN